MSWGQARRRAVTWGVTKGRGVCGGETGRGGDGREAGTSLRGRDAAALNHSRSLELQHDEASLIFLNIAQLLIHVAAIKRI